VNAGALSYASNALRLRRIRRGPDSITENKNQFYAKQPISFMVDYSFTGSHPAQQLDRSAVGSVDDYPAPVCAAYSSYIFQLDVGRVYLTQEKIAGLIE
jgi:hypothetical protein